MELEITTAAGGHLPDAVASSGLPLVWLLEDSTTQGCRLVHQLSSAFRVRWFADSLALLEALATDLPEALIVDWRVPEVSGLEVLRLTRETHDELTLPILILTASGNSEGDLLEALSAGANDFATKPCAEAELLARVATLVRVRSLYERARKAERDHEAALHRLEERAAYEQQLIGIVSHDLRTPISAIVLGASLLAKDSSMNARDQSIVKRVASSARRSARMIGDLLDLTAVRLGGGLPTTFAPVDLHSATSKALLEVQMANPERQLTVRQSGQAEGFWDAERIAQVIVNLTTNALHYSDASSAVTIETSADEHWASLSVHNHGPSISEELKLNLFSPMHRGPDRSQPNRKSVGLGLFIVHSVVKAHGGQIDVQSNDLDGTTFTVRLPRRAS